MPMPYRTRRTRRGFTLVELLTVVVIIAILLGMITTAAIQARSSARRAVIKMEIEQMSMAVEQFKNEYGDYPPNFFRLNVDHPDRASGAMTECQSAVMRVLRKAFPRYVPRGDVANPGNTPTQFDKFCYDLRCGDLNPTDPPNSNGYPMLNARNFDPASVLVFCLGGLPEQGGLRWKPAGFHADPQFPFKVGLPRTKPMFEFNPERIMVTGDGQVQYYPPGIETAPYVYFVARRLAAAGARYEYAVGNNFQNPSNPATSVLPLYCMPGSWPASANDSNVCVPYLDKFAGVPADSTDTNNTNGWTSLGLIRSWRNPETYQIICSGLDGRYGETEGDPFPGIDRFRFRCTRTGENFSPQGHDHDNLTNFTQGTLEDEML